MKKYLLFILLCLASNLFAISPKGLYLSPKFMFSHDANNAYIKDNGKQGYSIGKAVGMKKNFLTHTLLGTIYYDINFFFTNEEVNNQTKEDILKNQYPLFSIYLGFSIGTKINTQLKMRKTVGDALGIKDIPDNKLNISRSAIVFGFSLGFSYNIKNWLAADIGYRFVVDITPKWYHEVLLGLRFTFPKL